jgi:hypothetical protein
MDNSMFRNGAGKPVVALDIDGTLADYHKYFLWFASLYFGRPMPSSTTPNPGFPLHKFMNVKLRDYRDCKLAYRQGGMKRSMPVYEGASFLTEAIRNTGAEVWICTTRPYLRLDNIDPDTREWLRRNRISYDAVIFGEHKYEDLVSQIDPTRIVAAVDDLPEQVEKASVAGIEKIYMRNQPYNITQQQFREDFPDYTRFESCLELQRLLIEDINVWKEQYGKRQDDTHDVGGIPRGRLPY